MAAVYEAAERERGETKNVIEESKRSAKPTKWPVPPPPREEEEYAAFSIFLFVQGIKGLVEQLFQVLQDGGSLLYLSFQSN